MFNVLLTYTQICAILQSQKGKIICLTCGGEVVESDSIDIDVDTASVTLLKVGECDRCGNHYQWHEEYTLAGYRDLKQIHDESEDESDDIP